LLAGGSLSAQSITDVHVDPRPYLYKPYYGDTLQIPAKRIVYLKTFDRNRGNRSDTIFISDYDNQKRKTVYQSFDSDGKKKRYEYKYFRNRVLWTEQGRLTRSASRHLSR